jgi:hypothetical protein
MRRFVVTSLSREKYPAQPLYEKHYCERGEMENRIIKKKGLALACKPSPLQLPKHKSQLSEGVRTHCDALKIAPGEGPEQSL